MAIKPAEPYPGKLEYPINKEDQYNTKLVFQAVRVKPPKLTALGSGNSSDSVRGLTEGARGARNSGNSGSGVSNLKFFDIGGERADIYIPVGGFQVNDGFDYAQTSLGSMGAGASAALNRGDDLASSVMAGIAEAGQSFLDAFNVIKGNKDIGRAATLKASTLIPNEQLRNAAQITNRATMNPNIRTNFNGVAVREFNFSFKFIPCSPQESLSVKSLIKFFRFHSYPEEIASFGAFSVGFEYPNMFKIRLLSNSGNKHFKNIGTPIKLCYLKSVSVTYNATSPVLHKDGSPTEIDMNMTFVEYKAQTRKDIEAEGSDSFYHFENGPVSNASPRSTPSGGVSDGFGGGD
jgi:hypothetical protein|tara:strand:+ start:530 stop:1573 length:1044 start_codon:yes stop_codon:yes gene_type:complete